MAGAPAAQLYGHGSSLGAGPPSIGCVGGRYLSDRRPLYPTYRPGGTLIGKRSRDAFLREKRFEGNSSDQKMLRELYAQDAVLCLRSTHNGSA